LAASASAVAPSVIPILLMCLPWSEELSV